MTKVSTLDLVHINVHGVVQGVGFRPFVYQLASKHDLKGWVSNTSEDVKIEVEGKNRSRRKKCLQAAVLKEQYREFYRLSSTLTLTFFFSSTSLKPERSV